MMRLQEGANRNDLKILFSVQYVPGETQLWDVIDSCEPDQVEGVFPDFFRFGHGKQNLSYLFFLLSLLAFFVHQIGPLCDSWYQRCRAKFSSRREFWNQLRCTLRIIVFQARESLLSLMTGPDNWKPPP